MKKKIISGIMAGIGIIGFIVMTFKNILAREDLVELIILLIFVVLICFGLTRFLED